LALQNRTRVINTVRLKHATASTVAPLLMNLLRGTGSIGVGGRGNVPAAPGGFQVLPNAGNNQQNQGRGGQAGAAGGGAANQGRGGGGGGGNQVILPGTNVPVQLGGGRGGGGAAAQALGQILGGLGATQGNLAFTDIN